MDKACPWLIPVKLGYHPETNNRDPQGDKVPLGANIGVTHGKFKKFYLVRFNVSSLLVLYAQI